MDGPERDYVNWPRRERPIDKPPVRLHMFPEEWFTALHSKTGATGSLTVCQDGGSRPMCSLSGDDAKYSTVLIGYWDKGQGRYFF